MREDNLLIYNIPIAVHIFPADKSVAVLQLEMKPSISQKIALYLYIFIYIDIEFSFGFVSPQNLTATLQQLQQNAAIIFKIAVNHTYSRSRRSCAYIGTHIAHRGKNALTDNSPSIS